MPYVDRIIRIHNFFRENKRYNLMVVFFAPHGRTHQFTLPVKRLFFYLAIFAIGSAWVFGSIYGLYELTRSNRRLTHQLEASRSQLFGMQLRYENVIEKAYAAGPVAPKVVAKNKGASLIAPLPAQGDAQKPIHFAVVPLVKIGSGQSPAADLASDSPIKLGASVGVDGNSVINIEYFIKKTSSQPALAKGYVWALAVLSNEKKQLRTQVVPDRVVLGPGSEEPVDFHSGDSFKVHRIKRGKLIFSLAAAAGETLKSVVVVAVDGNGRPLVRELIVLKGKQGVPKF